MATHKKRRKMETHSHNYPAPSVTWTKAERGRLVRHITESFRENPNQSRMKLMEDAQAACLPPHRHRRLSNAITTLRGHLDVIIQGAAEVPAPKRPKATPPPIQVLAPAPAPAPAPVAKESTGVGLDHVLAALLGSIHRITDAVVEALRLRQPAPGPDHGGPGGEPRASNGLPPTSAPVRSEAAPAPPSGVRETSPVPMASAVPFHEPPLSPLPPSLLKAINGSAEAALPPRPVIAPPINHQQKTPPKLRVVLVGFLPDQFIHITEKCRELPVQFRNVDSTASQPLIPTADAIVLADRAGRRWWDAAHIQLPSNRIFRIHGTYQAVQRIHDLHAQIVQEAAHAAVTSPRPAVPTQPMVHA